MSVKVEYVDRIFISLVSLGGLYYLATQGHRFSADQQEKMFLAAMGAVTMYLTFRNNREIHKTSIVVDQAAAASVEAAKRAAAASTEAAKRAETLETKLDQNTAATTETLAHAQVQSEILAENTPGMEMVDLVARIHEASRSIARHMPDAKSSSKT